MAAELLVEDRIDGGRDLIARLVRDGFDVTVAFWVWMSEEELCFLYIASPAVTAGSLGDAYRAVYVSLSQVADPGVSISEIKLVESANPIARDALKIRDRYRARLPTRYRGDRLGNLAIQEAYIYPSSAEMNRQDVLQTVTSLMERTGSVQPSQVTLRDGSTLTAIPVGLHVQQPDGVQVTFRNVTTGNDQSVSADEIQRIQ